MPEPLTAKDIYEYIVGDFESAWNSLADRSLESAPSRCNFLFGSFAMTFLEWICRLCSLDGTGATLERFSTELAAVEPRYFASQPISVTSPREFTLPRIATSAGDSPVLWLLFDLIRNGQSHQYQQATLRLADTDFYIQLAGVNPGGFLDSRRREQHLYFRRNQNGELLMRVLPDLLFLDFKAALEASQAVSAHLSVAPVVRPSKGRHIISTQDLERAFREGGLVEHRAARSES